MWPYSMKVGMRKVSKRLIGNTVVRAKNQHMIILALGIYADSTCRIASNCMSTGTQLCRADSYQLADLSLCSFPPSLPLGHLLLLSSFSSQE